jgi:hypothetical protein
MNTARELEPHTQAHWAPIPRISAELFCSLAKEACTKRSECRALVVKRRISNLRYQPRPLPATPLVVRRRILAWCLGRCPLRRSLCVAGTWSCRQGRCLVLRRGILVVVWPKREISFQWAKFRFVISRKKVKKVIFFTPQSRARPRALSHFSYVSGNIIFGETRISSRNPTKIPPPPQNLAFLV